MPDIRLTGLDGSNPLGFLAALGVLRVVDPGGRLWWVDEGGWFPVLAYEGDLDALVARLLADVATWETDPALGLAWSEGGLCPPGQPGAVRDLKPPPKLMRAFLAGLVGTGEGRALETAAAYGTELAVDNNGNVKPTALHFTAGRQTFLAMVAQLQRGVRHEHLREALVGPWTGAGTLPTLSWDASVSRNYALRASDPSKEKRGGNPGADWLAFVGLAAFPVYPRPRPRFRTDTEARWQAVTTGVRGGWKDSVFTWPLWTAPCTWPVAKSLVSLPRLDASGAAERVARGIGAVFASGILRSEQGGYGSFTPARPA